MIALLHPSGRCAIVLLGKQAIVHGDSGVFAGVLQFHVVRLTAIGEPETPWEVPPLPLGALLHGADEVLESFLGNLADLLPAHAKLVTLPLPLLAGRALDLVAVLFGVRDQAVRAQLFQGLAYRLHAVALTQAAVEALGHQLG